MLEERLGMNFESEKKQAHRCKFGFIKLIVIPQCSFIHFQPNRFKLCAHFCICNCVDIYRQVCMCGWL